LNLATLAVRMKKQHCSVVYRERKSADIQCFDAVGWVAGRASGLQKLRGGVLAWLSVWSEVLQ